MDMHFGFIIFDWDGTAVPDGLSSGIDLIRALERALRAGIRCAAVTRTNFENLDKQTISFLSSKAKENLYVCTNRGSECFVFKSADPISQYKRIAAPNEESGLDRAANAVQQHLNGFGLRTEVITNRMNRRKIDLIPTPEWRAYRKSESPQLMKAVLNRLQSTQSDRTLSKLLNIAKTLAEESGIPNPRVTSDIKHIEIGLTDKSDSVRWLVERVVQRPPQIRSCTRLASSQNEKESLKQFFPLETAI